MAFWNTHRLLAAALVMLAASAPALAEQNVTKEQLIGTWQLKSFKATSGNQVSTPLGETPGGYIGFRPNRFWVMLVDRTRKAPATAALTDAEAVSLMKSSAAYTGRYDADPAQTPDGIKVTIQVDAAVNQALTGTTRVLRARRWRQADAEISGGGGSDHRIDQRRSARFRQSRLAQAAALVGAPATHVSWIRMPSGSKATMSAR